MSELIQQIRNTIGIQDPITRIAAAGFISVFTTFGILWVMQILIATGEGAITSKYEGRFVDFVRVKKDESLDTKNAKPKKDFRCVPGTESPHAPVMTRQNLRDASPRRARRRFRQCRQFLQLDTIRPIVTR